MDPAGTLDSTTWAALALVLLFLVSGAMRRDEGKHTSDLDDVDDIEAILKKHGI